MYEYEATVIRQVDGDTLYLRMNLGLDVYLDISARLADIDTPERGQAGWQEATDFAQLWLAQHGMRTLAGLRFRVRTVKDKREKFGRYLVHVYPLTNPDESLNTALLAAGWAKPYVAPDDRAIPLDQIPLRLRANFDD